jgi:hypothetical protein
VNTSVGVPTDEHMFLFWSRIDPVGDCWRWTGPLDKDGYARTKLHGKKIYAHRLSYELANGPMPRDKVSCHTCRLRSCVNPHHVYAGTVRDNVMDAIRDGTHRSLREVPPPRRREEHYHAVLTTDKAREMRCARSWGMRVRDLMIVFGVSETTVYGVVSGERWAED